MTKYLVMDVDGSLTDGKIYMGQSGELMKAFSVKDGYVFNYILKPNEIVPVVITARTSSAVLNRCTELGIKDVYQGKKDKLNTLKEIVGPSNLGECAYFGDDVLDLECINEIRRAGGRTGCPADAVREVKAEVDYVCSTRAGEGALREFVEWLTEEKVESEEISERVDAALRHLLNLRVSRADVGKYEVDENFFYMVQSYRTRSEELCQYESHKKYIDIQILVDGTERIDIADISRLTVKNDYDEKKDVTFWENPKRAMHVVMHQGDYVILYPENAHKAMISAKDENEVLKIVGKILIH